MIITMAAMMKNNQKSIHFIYKNQITLVIDVVQPIVQPNLKAGKKINK